MAKKAKKESVTPVGPSNLIYQIKITLKDVKPPIWRRIQVKSDITLHSLHRTIQTAMGWEDGHLHKFDIRAPSSEPKVRLNQLNLVEKQKFLYVYDFGDNWEHTILVEKILPIDEKTQYPICLAGERSGPPEDCGGPWGYMDLLDVLDDPNDPEYDERVEWIGEDFDPELFDIEKINKRLKGTRR
jgi:hypothetical protein